MPAILIVHTEDQLEQASDLVDLLETSLGLTDGAIACSSLPGYAWSGGIPLEQATAAVAFVDRACFDKPQLWFDLASALASGRRVAVVVDPPELTTEIPAALQSPEIVVRPDREALRALVEDLAFDLGVSPRLGRDAQRVLEQLSSLPPPPPPPVLDTATELETETESESLLEPVSEVGPPPPAPVLVAAPAAEADSDPKLELIPAALLASSQNQAQDELDFAELNEVPQPPRLPDLPTLVEADAPEATDALEPLELTDEAIEESEPPPVARLSQTVTRLRCESALEAGRAIGECAFHRDSADLGSELADTFGRFIDMIGGRWSEISRLGDIELWLAATDNLLEALPTSAREIAEWYEIGFQHATLKCIAEQGMPEDGEERVAYDEMWSRSMQQLWESAGTAQLPMRETRRVQTLLENVIGPVAYRDYSNLAGSLNALRELARAADRPSNRYARLAGS